MNHSKNKAIIYWLLTGCTLIFIMVIVGGITRLTHSGLSISDYRLIQGTLPPLNQQQWEESFELYKKYPEYQKLNSHFSLEDFKAIYFWEWLHRVLGRFIGLVFIVPFLFFLVKRKLDTPLLKKCIVLLAMGAFQGFLGWYMVKSGLVDRPDVSHYRLAAHLTTAFLTFSYCLWVALDLIYANKKVTSTQSKGFRNLIRVAYIVLMLQIIWGAFVAGLDAGFVHNHWPTMNEGKWIHETVYIEQNPLYLNFIEGRSGVQFVHRYLAYAVVFFVALIWFRSRKIQLAMHQERGLRALVVMVTIQFLLGVLTLLFGVPVWLGVVHQVGAFLLLAVMTFVLHRFSKFQVSRTFVSN